MSPWIKSPAYDTAFILAPPFVALAIVAVLPEQYGLSNAMPVAAWVVLVLLIDVAHVYSTLFRTYADPARFRRQRATFLLVPVICYGLGTLLYSLGADWFWRGLAYVAVFHFIRQQYGFLKLYNRHSPTTRLDVWTIYAATLYPILWWHLSPNRNFNWFVDGDFWQPGLPATSSDTIKLLLGIAYLALLLAYVGQEIWRYLTRKEWNVPRQGLVLGTALSWYVGIVWFNGDLTFTLLNVVAHGIPYMALIWVSNRRTMPTQLQAKVWGVLLFTGFLALLAYLEEGLWDGLVWRDHATVFAPFQQLPALTNSSWLVLIVPLLALPQLTHYVLDGFIWRRGDAGTLPSSS
ncbi:hypothetical protein [uncultured Fibrella sp.]|uniref:hypothetical protein n=1 Tax=uncultured Fibrella sp. TaxID=1284596 RepID=UPI0035CB438D